MTERLSHKFVFPRFGILLLMLVWLLASAVSSTAQQDNRQLKREQLQLNEAEQRRIALVIGNGSYQNVAALKNPTNDATLLAATLRKLGFEVTVATDKSQREMKLLIREFGQQLRAGGSVGLFYFAGHGVQARGHNYLIPVDADIQTEADLEDVAVDVHYVLNMMDDAQNALNIAILDACRNNPFARSFRSAQEGLAQVKAPTGTLIAYATAPDSVAADGGGANSPYAEELTKQIQVSGVLVETMFRRVAEKVSSRSGGRQEPWYSANVKGDFYFSNGPTESRVGRSNPENSLTGSTGISEGAKEQGLWEAVQDSNEPQDFRDYLLKYPRGAYAAAAKIRLRRLENSLAEPNSSAHSGYEVTFHDLDATFVKLVPSKNFVRVEDKEGHKLKICKGDTILVNIPGLNVPGGLTLSIGGGLTTFQGNWFSGPAKAEGLLSIRLNAPPNWVEPYTVTINLGRGTPC